MTKQQAHSLTRRTFLGGMASVSAPLVLGSSLKNAQRKPQVAVIGAGAFGAWTALHLLRLGASVTLYDAWGPGNSRSSSGGEGRAIRAIYGADRVYSEMVAEAFEQWQGLEKDSGQQLYTPTGALWLMRSDDRYIRSALPILNDLGLPVEQLSLIKAARKYRQIDPEGINHVYFERKAGVLAARQSCQALCDQFLAEGGTFALAQVKPGAIQDKRMAGVRLQDGKTTPADKLVFACGPWLGKVFPGLLEKRIQPTRQEVYYFGTPAGDASWQAPNLPIWIDFGTRIYYGFPNLHGRGFKIADDTRGVPTNPSYQNRNPTPELVDQARSFLKLRFPKLRHEPLLESRVCQYENSPDGHLILDRHPDAENVWIAGGGSGHGFKLSPSIGKRLAQAVLNGASLNPRFSLARFKEADAKRTQFDQ